ncbi:Na+/Pi symporter [Blyttiomyces sp. JEL0837]|nr:Na+/Pi symporter [Blyttiomyces sp. JEL0837]
MAPTPIPAESFTWIFAVTMIFAFMDAYAIGANDVANSFATSVGSRSLKLWQACVIAIFTEFIGAIAMGASTTSTIKDGIIQLSSFDKRQDLLMVAFMCALIGSSTWVMYATRMGWPVSTTHSIVGAIIGVGVSAFGTDAVNWQWVDAKNNKGVAQIVASWFIAPISAGVFAAIIYVITRQFIFKAKDSLKAGIYAIPVYFTITAAIATFFVASKNGKSTLSFKQDRVGGPITTTGDLTTNLAAVGGVAGGVLLINLLFICPFFWRRLVNEEKLEWYHIFYVFAVPKQPKDENITLWLKKTLTPQLIDQTETEIVVVSEEKKVDAAGNTTTTTTVAAAEQKNVMSADNHTDFSLSEMGAVISRKVKGIFGLASKGVLMDVATVQSEGAHKAHEAAVLYDNKTEFLFSYLQVMTASFASFSHGSNDVANAIGPLAAVYAIWHTGSVASKAPVETWQLAYGGAAIDFGLALYGWRIMINLGNNLTYHSPSRGFCMELGAALSVLTSSFIGWPVSTTQCIMGATIAVGLCNGTVKAINWRMASWTFFSWCLTLPIAGISAGILFAFIARGPNVYNPTFGSNPTVNVTKTLVQTFTLTQTAAPTLL